VHEVLERRFDDDHFALTVEKDEGKDALLEKECKLSISPPLHF